VFLLLYHDLLVEIYFSDMEKRKKALEKLREQLAKLELQATDKEENKEIALGTSKLNYLDPRISVAW
jgi:DNA topoisomerase-1